MKSIFTILGLLISGLFFGQTMTLTGINEAQAKTVADLIASGSSTKWEFLSAKKNGTGDYYSVRYVNAALAKDVKEGIAAGDPCDDCLKVTFHRSNTGELRFYQVVGKYDDLIGGWQKLFRPDADRTKTKSDDTSQELQVAADVRYKFKKDADDAWSIRRWN